MSDILNGKIKRPPDWEVTIAVVRACLEHAEAKGRPVPPDLRDRENWRRRYADLEQDFNAGTRSRDRREVLSGWLLAEATDPFALEVHHPVQPDAPQPGLPVLPAYLYREHDAELEQIVAAAAQGSSGIAVLVGGSSTGKTRACWEALRLLRDLPKPWRLWHPIDPSRPEAALRELPSIGSRTVIWLNEAQFYLDSPDGLGERVAAGLRELLRDRERAPVLVLATLWPEFWGLLTARPAAGEDRHSQARELLTGRDISVPAAFTAAQLPLLAATGDPRLALAAAAAEEGRAIQFLAGAPELMARYRNAPPAVAALLSAAMDARRLGIGVALPLAFLEAAASGYLSDAERDVLSEDWLEHALAYTAAPCKGTRGPLARIRPPADGNTDPAPAPAYRLADYLEQHGRHARRQHVPPSSFWTAAAHFGSPGDLPALALAAEDRGMLRDAARLLKRATELGHSVQAAGLIHLWCSVHPHAPDPNPAKWAAAHASLDNPSGVGYLLDTLQRAGAAEQAAALLARDPAAHASLDNPSGVGQLLDALREVGAAEQAATLLARDPAAHASLDDLDGVVHLLNALREAGAAEQFNVLARRAVFRAPVDHGFGVAGLLQALRRERRVGWVATLARRSAPHASLDDSVSVALIVLLDVLREAGAEDQAAALATRAADHRSLDDPGAVAVTLSALRWAGAEEQAAALARRAATHAALDDSFGVALLLTGLREAGTEEQAAALLARDPAAHVSLDNPDGVGHLLGALRKADATEQTATLLARVSLDAPCVAYLLDSLQEADGAEQAAALLARDPAAHVSLENPGGVGHLLDALRKADGAEQAAALLARDPAAHVSLENPGGVGHLLDALRKADGAEQAAALLARDPAAHVSLDIPAVASVDMMDGIARLLDALREAGAAEQVRVLVDRLAAEGLFPLFRVHAGHQADYRFGREPDGSPAPSWDWDDLG